MPDLPDRTLVRSRPAVVTAGVVFAIAAGVLNALIGVFFVTQAFRSTVLDAQGRTVPLPASGALTVSILAIIAFAFAGGVIALALLTRRGRTWARPALLALSLFSVPPIIVSLSIPALLVTLLLAVADVLVYRPSVTRWHRGLRGLPPG